MPRPPITEEDAPAVASMIKRLKRLRQRQHEHQRRYGWTGELDDAIAALHRFGADRGWWKEQE